MWPKNNAYIYIYIYICLVKTCDIWTLNNHAKNLLTEDQTKMDNCVLSFLKIPMSARRVGLIWEQHRPYPVRDAPGTEPFPTLMLPDDDDDGPFYVNVCSCCRDPRLLFCSCAPVIYPRHCTSCSISSTLP